MSDTTNNPLQSIEINAPIAAILSLLFFVVFLLCLLKDFLPSLKKLNLNYARISVLYLLILLASILRAGFFLLIALSSFGVIDSVPFPLFWGFWWIPDFLISISLISFTYLWCKIFSSSRNLFLYTQKKFRKQIGIMEIAFITFISIFQLCLFLLIIFTSSNTNWAVVDQIFIGVLSIFVAMIPINVYLLIKLMTVPTQSQSGVKLSHKLLIILIFWIIGRFARAFDCISTVPSWSTWDENFATSNDYYWIYVGGLYLISEFIPEILILLTSIMAELIDYKFSPQNMNKKQEKKVENERLKLINEVKGNIKRIIETEDLDFSGETLGTGTFATVYKALYNRRYVAIKSFNQKLIQDRAFFELFCHEVEIMSNLKHPNIIEFLGACIDRQDQIYIVTELAEKGSLSTILRDRSVYLTDQQLSKWALQIANGMYYLHACNIMHRDLKSDNILVTKKNQCKVADFGVSRIFKQFASTATFSLPSSPILSEFSQVGTLSWMAPEMFHSKTYDLKVDVYSYAIILWEMMARESPHNEIGKEAIEEKIKYGVRPHIPKGPPHLIALMKNCWAERPEDRPSFIEIVKYLSDNQNLYDSFESNASDRKDAFAPVPDNFLDY